MCILLTLTLVLMMPAAAQAASINVTKKMSSNKKVQRLIKASAIYADVTIIESKSKKTINQKMDGASILSMSAYMSRCDGRGIYWTKKEIQKLTYDFFGKKPSVSLIPSSSSRNHGWIVRNTSKKFLSSKPYTYGGGDWGCYDPGYKGVKIIQKSKNVYEVTYTNTLGSWEKRNSTRNIGKTTMQIKKNSKSTYGYVITKLQFKSYGLSYGDIG